MWELGFDSVRAFITFPNADNDLLIIFASSSTCPDAIVFPTFSDPAKSHKNSFPTLALSFLVFF